jgi:hypothetical protein
MAECSFLKAITPSNEEYRPRVSISLPLTERGGSVYQLRSQAVLTLPAYSPITHHSALEASCYLNIGQTSLVQYASLCFGVVVLPAVMFDL